LGHEFSGTSYKVRLADLCPRTGEILLNFPNYIFV
jgi:hypothetical protein